MEARNYEFFKNSPLPAMIIMVSGGELTDEYFEEVKDAFKPKEPN